MASMAERTCTARVNRGAGTYPQDDPVSRHYWIYARRQGRDHALIRDLGNGCRLSRHWTVDRPDIAFPPTQIDFHWEPEELPDTLAAPFYVRVSETARDLLQAIDPGAHQFFPVRYVDTKGRPWTRQTFFGMVVGPQVETPLHTEPHRFVQRPPVVSSEQHGVRGQALAILNAAPGLQSVIDEFPIWRMPFRMDLIWSQQVMDAIATAGLKGLGLIEPGMKKGDDQSVIAIDTD